MPGMKGRSGAKPRPNALKVLLGNPGRRPLPSEPDVPPGIPEPPDFLDKTALRKWHEILSWCHWITPADGDMLALYCDAWSRYLQAVRLAKEPVIWPDGPMKNPAWTCIKEAFQQIRSAASELGLSPAGRIGIPERKGKRNIAEKYFT